MNYNSSASNLAFAETRARFMSQVYTWMSLGITLSALVAWYVSQSEDMLSLILQNRNVFMGVMIAEIGLVIGLSALMPRLAASTATFMYFLYCALSGVTLSVIFLTYTQDSIVGVFASTAVAFAGLSLVGYTTKRDLGPVGTFCSMALFGMLGFALLSWFFPSLWSEQSQTVYSIVGVVVFSGLTAYDTQKIKAMATGGLDSEQGRKGAIFGALMLYLDFINLFLSLLRLAGRRR